MIPCGSYIKTKCHCEQRSNRGLCKSAFLRAIASLLAMTIILLFSLTKSLMRIGYRLLAFSEWRQVYYWYGAKHHQTNNPVGIIIS